MNVNPTTLPHLLYILFLFALGASIGSFLNVVVWRLPRGESIVSPPSRCPKCEHKLAWYDNIPIFGWISLRGKCRYCGNSISARYPIIETFTAILFVLYYVLFFIAKLGPCLDHSHGVIAWGFGSMTSLEDNWPIYFLYMALIAGLLAASLIDAELFIIPLEIPWLLAAVGIIAHTIIDRPLMPGTVQIAPASMALSAGATIGLLISVGLWWIGKMPTSFPNGEPILEVDRPILAAEMKEAKARGEALPPLPPEYTKPQIRGEIRKEMLFLMPALMLGFIFVALYLYIPAIHHLWHLAATTDWIPGLLGALLGGMIGGFVVWITRILGTLGFGRVAMGLGDVHLMFGVGAILGPGPATVAFFMAPFFGIVVAVYMLLTGTRRELPYGPYLSLATAFVMLFYSPIAAYLTPGLLGLLSLIHSLTQGG